MSKDFLSPTEVKKINSGKKRVIMDENFEPDRDYDEGTNDEEGSTADSYYKKESGNLRAINNAGKAKIEFETMGRFNIPATMYFSGYTVDHIDNFAVVDEDNIFETLVAIVNELNSDKNIRVEDMLIEEFFETLISIKAQFNTISHVHRWVCDCQESKSDKERIINETLINLAELKYTSIEQADEKFKKIGGEGLRNKSVFENYIKVKYGEEADIDEFDVEDEISKLKIAEPFSIGYNGSTYKFKFMRVGDLISSNRYIYKKYMPKIKAIKNKVLHGVKADELRIIKEEELKEINKQKAKEFLRAIKASSLCEINGERLEELEEKMEAYKDIPVDVSISMSEFLEEIRFGIDDEHTYECPICGYSEQRSLQREFNFIEFIPTKSDSANGLRSITRGSIFMGV